MDGGGGDATAVATTRSAIDVNKEDQPQEQQEGAEDRKPAAVDANNPSNNNDNNNNSSPPPKIRKIIVIGAGMSGLAAARELQYRGFSVLVVEARNRPGGRLKACTFNEHTKLDVGGALIHGVQDNPLVRLMSPSLPDATLEVKDCLLYDDSGWPVDPKRDEKISKSFNDALDATFHCIQNPVTPDNSNDNNNNAKSTTNNNEATTINNNHTTEKPLPPPRRSQRSTVQSKPPPQPKQRKAPKRKPKPDPSFGQLFDQICNQQNIVRDRLFQWHQRNLELGCGASFSKLGFLWNEDEPYGYDGPHVALRNSWEPILQDLASQLYVVYDTPVSRIQVVPPQRTRPLRPSTVSPPRHKKRPIPSPPQSAPPVPSRISKRVKGIPPDQRRSERTKKNVSLFTVDTTPQFLSSPSAASQQNAKLYQPHVKVHLENGLVLQADAVVCTVPLALLQQEAIAFDPPLSVEKQDALQQLGPGVLNKCVLLFSKVFWPDSDFLGLADEHSYIILNGHKISGQPTLVFMYGGPLASTMEEWTDQVIVNDCLRVLRKLCHQIKAALLDYQVTRWSREQYSQMSFTYIPPGVDGMQALRTVSQPIYCQNAPVVLFAGEHTTPFHPSTIHGAFLSGIREAYRLDCLLHPAANEHLEFDEMHVYEPTFVKPPVAAVTANGTSHAASTAVAATPPPPPPPRQQRRPNQRPHKRNGMKLRRRPRHFVSRTVEAQTTHRAPETANGGTRRSQRGANEEQPTTLSKDSLAALEDRIVVRSMDSYGDLEYVSEMAFPVHGSTSVPRNLVRRYSKAKKAKVRRPAFLQSWISRDSKRGKKK